MMTSTSGLSRRGTPTGIWAGALVIILACVIGLVVGGDAAITEIKGW